MTSGSCRSFNTNPSIGSINTNRHPLLLPLGKDPKKKRVSQSNFLLFQWKVSPTLKPKSPLLQLAPPPPQGFISCPTVSCVDTQLSYEIDQVLPSFCYQARLQGPQPLSIHWCLPKNVIGHTIGLGVVVVC